MAPRRLILLATRNAGKVRELAEVLAPLGIDVEGLDGFDDLPEPVEDGETFAANAAKKAVWYSTRTGQWCLADDSGLVVDALDGRPGVHSARYACDRVADDAPRSEIDQANNRKLLDELDGVGDDRRTARFVCHLTLADGETILAEVEDCVEGRIGHEPRGSNGFGYDPLFVVPELDCTTAELPPERKNEISHRGKASRAMARVLGECFS